MKLLISFVFLAATAFGQYAGSSFVVLANGTMTYRDTSSPANTAVFEAPTTISTNYVAVLPTNGGSVGTALVVNSQSCAGTPTVCTDQLAWSGSVACTDCMVTTGGQTVTGTDTFSAAQIFSGGLEIADSMGNTVTFTAPSATFSSSYTLYLPVNPPGATGQALVLEPLSNSQLEWGTCGGCLTTAGGQTISGSDTWNADQTYGGNILFSTNNTYNVGSAVKYAANVYSENVDVESTLVMPSGGGAVTMGISGNGQSGTVATGTCSLTFVYGWLTASSGSCTNTIPACSDCLTTDTSQTVTSGGTKLWEAQQTLDNGVFLAGLDTASNTIQLLAMGSGNNLNIGPQQAPVSAGGIKFFINGDNWMDVTNSGSTYEMQPAVTDETSIGDSTHILAGVYSADFYGGSLLFSANNTYSVGSAVDAAENVYGYNFYVSSLISMPSAGGAVTMGISGNGQSATVDTGTCALTFVYGWLTSSSGSCNNPTFGTVTSVATSSPITGGTITTTGTIGCSTCLVTGGGQTISGSDTWNANQTYGGNILFSANNTYNVGSSVDYAANVYSYDVNINSTLSMPSGGGAVTMGISGSGQSTTVDAGNCAFTFVYGWFTAKSGSCSATSGTVTSIATTGPITGGTITTSGTIACATCVDTTDTFTLQGQYTMGSSSNLYLRTISGAPSCSGVGNGWIGVDTSGLSLDICVGGTLYQIPL